LAQTTFGPVFLIVAAVVGGGRHVWTCRDGGSDNGCGGHSCGGGRFVFCSFLWFFVTSSLVITEEATDTSHVWTCRDGGSGNGHGGRRLSSLCFSLLVV
jgi:hypothetical protein